MYSLCCFFVFCFSVFYFVAFFEIQLDIFFLLKEYKNIVISLVLALKKIELYLKLAWNLQPHNHKHKIDIIQSVNWDMTEGLHVPECEQMAEPCITVPSQNL